MKFRNNHEVLRAINANAIFLDDDGQVVQGDPNTPVATMAQQQGVEIQDISQTPPPPAEVPIPDIDQQQDPNAAPQAVPAPQPAPQPATESYKPLTNSNVLSGIFKPVMDEKKTASPMITGRYR